MQSGFTTELRAIYFNVLYSSSNSNRTELSAHFQQLIAGQSNQLLANYFFIHSQHSEKEGRQERME